MAGAEPKRGRAVKLRILPIAHRLDRPLGPIEIRPHVCTALATDLANKAWLNIGQPDSIGPAIPVDRERVAAAIVAQ